MLNTKSLREQIYDFIKLKMQDGELEKGTYINMNLLSNELGISKTPLRDALIQLETEGFVSILPRKGIMVNKLTLKEIKESYQIIGALEAAVVKSVFNQLTTSHIRQMETLNQKQYEAINNSDFETYYRLNLDFHGVFLDLSDNDSLKKIITPIKQRLYDFPRRSYLHTWESQHLEEHQAFIDCIRQKDVDCAVRILKDKHWSYPVHERYFKQFYQLNDTSGDEQAPTSG